MNNTKIKKISLILPSRGRKLLLETLLENIAQKTLLKNQVEIILILDGDDIPSHDVDSDLLDVKKIIGPRASMGAYNTMGLDAASGGIIILINDDMLIQTDGWDEKIRAFDAKISDKVYLAYPNDLFKGKCTFPILSRQTCVLLQRPFPIEYKGAFIDTHLFDIFERLKKQGINRTFFLEDIIFEHRHYRSGKASFDETYRNRNRFGDDQVFIDLIAFRKHNSIDLINKIQGKKVGECFNKSKPIQLYQGHFVSLPYKFYCAFFKDKTLPFKRRSYLTLYFFARTVFYRIFGPKKAN